MVESWTNQDCASGNGNRKLEAAGNVETAGMGGSARVKSEERTHPLRKTKPQRVGHPKSSRGINGVPPARYYDPNVGRRVAHWIPSEDILDGGSR